MDSEISDNRSSIQTPTSIATKQWTEILQVSGPDPGWYKYLLVKMTFHLWKQWRKTRKDKNLNKITKNFSGW